MNKIKPILLLFLAICILQACTPKAVTNSDENVKMELQSTIQQFNEAFQNGEVSVLEQLIPNNYVHTNGNSKSIGKEQWLNYLKKREQQIQSGQLKVLNYQLQEEKLTIHNGFGVLTGKISTTFIMEGDTISREYRITNIWKKEKEGWKRAVFHDTKL